MESFVKGDLDRLDLPYKDFDIIVSEWMGLGLHLEGMLSTVLAARDRYLVPGGLIVPSHVSVHVAPFSSTKFMLDKVWFLHDVSLASPRGVYFLLSH